MKRESVRHYISVKWTHTHSEEPVLILSELNGYNEECRKIEYFQDGSVGLASSKIMRGTTRLGNQPLPELAKINEDPQFDGKEIDEGEFNSIWEVYV